MSEFDLNVWIRPFFPKGFTHVISGGFCDPQVAMQNARDFFCYDRETQTGRFFSTVINGRLDDGRLVDDGPIPVGSPHTFNRKWTQIVAAGTSILFYDRASGVGEFHAYDNAGGLHLKKRHTGWRTSWTHIIFGRFGRASLLFYDAAAGFGEFYSLNADGEMSRVSSHEGWRTDWHTILPGNFSDSPRDDLLFYERSTGTGEFYRLDDHAAMTKVKEHVGWRRSWQSIVAGAFSPSSRFDGLLFHEEGTGFTQVYSSDGHGNLSRIDVAFPNQWRLPWQHIFAGAFTHNLGITSIPNLCAYEPASGVLGYFFTTFSPSLFQLAGRWAAGGTPGPVISVNGRVLSVDMSAYHRPAAHGTIIDSDTISVTFPDDATFTATLQPPGTLRWSNNSTWTKA
jgi:hypothetical protein